MRGKNGANTGRSIYNVKNGLVSLFGVKRRRRIDFLSLIQGAITHRVSLLVTARTIKTFLERTHDNIVG